MSVTREGLLLALLALLALLPACEAETGILVSVASRAGSHDALEFQIGVLQPSGDFILDQAASGQRRDVAGRDLNASPYELMVLEERPTEPTARLRVLVLGYRGSTVRSFALTDPPQPFVRDEVVRRGLSLEALNATYRTVTAYNKTCYRVFMRVGDKDKYWYIKSKSDLDCDGYTSDGSPKDCDDADPDVNPKAAEICDGKDNNCDGKYAPSAVPCYGLDGPDCKQGTRACDDQGGGGLKPGCVTAGARVPQAYCDAYAKCTGADPFGCARSAVKVIEADCTIEQDTSGICGGAIKLQPPATGTSCRWEVISTGGYSIGLSDGTSAPASSSLLCAPQLVLTAGSGPAKGTVLLEFFGAAGEPSSVVKLTLSGSAAGTCGVEPIHCNVKSG